MSWTLPTSISVLKCDEIGEEKKEMRRVMDGCVEVPSKRNIIKIKKERFGFKGYGFNQLPVGCVISEQNSRLVASSYSPCASHGC